MSEVTRSHEATSAAEAAGVDRARGSLSTATWAILLGLATELTLFASLIATYFYLRFKDVAWPPDGVPKPEVTLPLVFTGMLLVSTLPVFASVRAAKGGRVRIAWWLLAVAAAIQATYLGLQINLFVDDINKFSPSESAYGSIYFALVGIHHAHVALGLALDAWLLGRLMSGLTHYRLLALRVVALYWYFVAAIAVAVVLTQLYPSL
ncbi:MAG: cytochrome c oxidase subunit 3 [Solirubrobacterales bacterium]